MQASRLLIAILIALAAFMEVLDISVANVSLLHIAGSLSASQNEATWVLTSYAVTNAIIIPMSGWLSSVLGRKRFFLWSIALFTLASLTCGLAPTLDILILSRAIQGIAGGGLQPCSQAMMSDLFPPELHNIAFAIYGISAVLAPSIGPTLGGWITDSYSWRWVFLMNIPIGLLIYPLILRYVVEPEYLKKKQGKVGVDYIGFALLTLGIGSLQLFLDRGQESDWFNSTFILVLSVIVVCALVSFVIWELWQKNPLVSMKLLKKMNFFIAFWLMFVTGFILYASTILLPLYVQNILGYTSLDAGLILTPGSVFMVFALAFVGYLLQKIHSRTLIAFGFLCTGTGFWLSTNFDCYSAYLEIASFRAISTFGFAFLFLAINFIAYEGIMQDDVNNAAGIINLARNIGGSFGISITSTLLVRRTQYHQSNMVDKINYLSNLYHHEIAIFNTAIAHHVAIINKALANTILYNEAIRQATMLAFINNFKFMEVLSLIMIPCAFLIKRNTWTTNSVPPLH